LQENATILLLALLEGRHDKKIAERILLNFDVQNMVYMVPHRTHEPI
jgi:hypothetical protein